MFEKNLLAGRAVLITGGGTGLGRSMALRMAELGAKIFLVARRREPLEETAAAIRKAGGVCEFATADVRDFAAVESAIGEAEAKSGAIDTLINNAAGNFIARTEKLSPTAFSAVTGIVLHGSFHCTLALGRRWIAAKRAGTVLSITTTYAAANCGSGYVVPSACAKAGVLAMTTSLAVEWAKYKIRLNAIAPGPFPTEGAWSRLMPSADLEKKALESHPMKRFGKHEELANLAVYLISDAAGYINGECVVIDGGLWLKGAGEFNELGDLPETVWEKMEIVRQQGRK